MKHQPDHDPHRAAADSAPDDRVRLRPLVSVGALRALGLFGFWLLLTGAAPADLATGLAAALAATWASLWLLPPRPGRRWRLTALVRLAGRWSWQAVVAGVQVAWLALQPRLRLQPGFIAYPARLRPGPARDTFGAITSLLPGTLPVGSDADGALVYHCLDVTQPIAAQLAADEALLRRALGESDDDD
ncbi:Na+/H+ antiporter subunit E [Thioalkalicoccus limnaeus]|uniref:Na+/H+ antiporter subunit E n=1 Tax=Thioalkalicoccus limnaeus TaxID=120681 RepID=A0ABV4BH47_9GAMM